MQDLLCTLPQGSLVLRCLDPQGEGIGRTARNMSCLSAGKTCSYRRLYSWSWQVLYHLTANMLEVVCCDAIGMQVLVIGLSIPYFDIKEHLHGALRVLIDAVQ